MKPELKAKLLLYCCKLNNNQGFTTLGLLVRLLIYGSAVTALSSSFYIVPCENCHENLSQMSRPGKGRQAEGKQYVSSVNKAQQAYYTENNQFVTTSDDAAWGSLGVGIKTQTTNYRYRIQSPYPSNGPFQKKDDKIISAKPKEVDDYVMVTAEPLSPKLKSYVGIVGLVGKPDADKTSQAVVCESKEADLIVKPIIMPPVPPSGLQEVDCPEGFSPLK
ncbi:type IV pilin-like G/H family protein [Floridanema aerugineum]|uniref:Type IV pilin-like G/H family protein n=1 Tax=Floridaenema aerugineum BLCC-F46 TaxID=3153654 RepID=A0ABV4XIA5_9CYAN